MQFPNLVMENGIEIALEIMLCYF